MAERPTERAKKNFGYAGGSANQASHQIKRAGPLSNDALDRLYEYNLAEAVSYLAQGSMAMADGLRATYVLLEEVRRLLEQQRRQ